MSAGKIKQTMQMEFQKLVSKKLRLKLFEVAIDNKLNLELGINQFNYKMPCKSRGSRHCTVIIKI